MGGRGNSGDRNSSGTGEQPTITLGQQIATHPMRGLFEDKDIRKSFVDNIIEVLIKHPDEGSIRLLNYDFYGLTGKEFSNQFQKMKSVLNKNGYEATVEDGSHTEAGAYRLRRGYGFRYEPQRKTLGKTLRYKKKKGE